MKKTQKKGFTIVELVIVIAVIAILAAVLIPTFTGIVKKARQSNDTQLIRNLNTALAVDGEHITMSDALKAAAEFGYDVEKINASATDKEILWDSVNDLFCYYDKETGEPTYIPDFEPETEAEDYQMWMISDTVDVPFSVYYTGTATEIVTSKGFDAGTSTGITSVKYTNGSGTAQEVVIRTNSHLTTLEVNAPTDTIYHYETVGRVNLISVDVASYHEYGEVTFLEVAGGHIVLEASAKIDALHFTATNNEFKNEDDKTISVDLSKVADAKKLTFTRDEVTVATDGTLVAEVTGASSEFLWLWGNEIVVSDTADDIAENGVLNGNLTAGAPEGSIMAQVSAVADSGAAFEGVRDILKGKQDLENAALNGDCLHDYQFDSYIGDAPSCLTGGVAKLVCSLCKNEKIENVAPLGHDLIGVYCNRCKHPVAFVDQITDFTPADEAGKKVDIYDIFGANHPAYDPLYLDIAYSFKTFPNNDMSILDDATTYSYDEATKTYYPDENGTETAQHIFESFSGWLCDYFVSFDSDVKALSCGLGGSYAGINVGFLSPMDIEANVEIPLLGSVSSGGESNWTYGDIAEKVSEFKCGFFNLSEENVGKTFTVKLRMTDSTTNEFIDVAVTNYVIEKPSAENLAIVNSAQ